MSRVANAPIQLPKGVEVTIKGQEVTAKGKQGSLTLKANVKVQVVQDGEVLRCSAKDNAKQSRALAGTTRALLNNMVNGVATGFEKKLQLVGVGYRAKAAGKVLNLTLGYSHPIDYKLPDGVTVDTPSQTEIVLKSTDKQLLGQVAAEVRSFRAPEPYKGKGVRYSDEQVLRKEAKKK
jgi:large subunit ribosomal protein L6